MRVFERHLLAHGGKSGDSLFSFQGSLTARVTQSMFPRLPLALAGQELCER